MKNDTMFVSILRRKILLENALEELTQLRDEAFSVFNNLCSLEKIKEIIENQWQNLAVWNQRHAGVPRIKMQRYHDEIKKAFNELSEGRINRDEFEKALKKSCNAIEETIETIYFELSQENEKLDALYDEFVENAGEFKFIFKEESIRDLIINKLLKL